MDTTIDESGLLSECLFCGYSLEGLPVEHKCPECGHAFDRRWQVFGARSSFRSRSLAAGLMEISSWLVMAIIIIVVSLAFMPPLANAVVAVVFLSIVVVVVWVAIRSPIVGSNRFVIICDDGIMVCDRRKGCVEHLAWSEIAFVKRHELFKIMLGIRRDTLPLKSSRVCFSNATRDEAKRCAVLIRKHIGASERIIA